MRIGAEVQSSLSYHRVALQTGDHVHSLQIPPRSTSFGSSVSGGELLMLALATCYCNDIYREAARSNISVDSVEVEAEADFAGLGLAATNITYRARVVSSATQEAVDALLLQTDAVAEVHNTIRSGASVSLRPWTEGHSAARNHKRGAQESS